MKKQNYISPTVDLTKIEIEVGIAMSTQTVDGFSNIYLNEEDVEW